MSVRATSHGRAPDRGDKKKSVKVHGESSLLAFHVVGASNFLTLCVKKKKTLLNPIENLAKLPACVCGNNCSCKFGQFWRFCHGTDWAPENHHSFFAYCWCVNFRGQSRVFLDKIKTGNGTQCIRKPFIVQSKTISSCREWPRKQLLLLMEVRIFLFVSIVGKRRWNWRGDCSSGCQKRSESVHAKHVRTVLLVWYRGLLFAFAPSPSVNYTRLNRLLCFDTETFFYSRRDITLADEPLLSPNTTRCIIRYILVCRAPRLEQQNRFCWCSQFFQSWSRCISISQTTMLFEIWQVLCALNWFVKS